MILLICNIYLQYSKYCNFSTVQGKDGLFYIATYGNGLFVYDPAADRLEQYSANDKRPIIASNYLINIHTDRDGNIWVGHEDAGIACLHKKAQPQTNHILPEPDMRGEKTNYITKLTPQNDGSLLVSTRSHQAYSYNPVTNTISPFGTELFDNVPNNSYMNNSYKVNSLNCLLFLLKIRNLISLKRTRPYLKGEVHLAPELIPDDGDTEFMTAIADLRNAGIDYIKQNEDIPDEAQFAIQNINNHLVMLNFICSSMPFAIEEKMKLLEESNLKERVIKVLRIMHRELQLEEIKQDIRSRTREDLDEQQREYFLQQQIRNIKEELGNGEGSPERKELVEKAEKKKWNEDIRTTFFKELDKLDMLNPQGPEYSVQLNYLQTLVNLPWGEFTSDDLNLKRAQRILDKDHYGMEKVKERILEYMAVLSLRGDLKSPIICLYGPPGVGKTSLGKSIAEAMKRKYVRISLGGMHDESEIRGHRRTYVGAMPGRIIKAIQKAGSSNPVFILDEIDKVTQNTINGDPSSALLEVLDPEQNSAFHDNYLDVDYDLSKVLFITTANDLNTIPRPLLDRMEVIEVSGYITEEKIEIAKRHLIPKEKENTGLATERSLQFNKAATEKIIEQYTRESGVRQLEKQINKALRKLAFTKAKEMVLPYQKITPNEIEGLLGKPPFYRDIYQGNAYAGVVTGLAWTSVGGEILFIETSLSKGKGSKLTLTGNLGDVMKESAVLALEYVKAHADTLKIDYRIFDNWNIHIHVPEGATPKDGPSAAHPA